MHLAEVTKEESHVLSGDCPSEADEDEDEDED